MLINSNNRDVTNNIKFISYTGKYPNLCRGILTLEIDGEKIKFGYGSGGYDRFWKSGGECGFRGGYKESYCYCGEWVIDINEIPKQYQKYAYEIDRVFNENVEFGCCGGCL